MPGVATRYFAQEPRLPRRGGREGHCQPWNLFNPQQPLGEGRVEAPPTLFPSTLNLIKLHQYVTIPVLIYLVWFKGTHYRDNTAAKARVGVRTMVLGNHAVQTRVLGPNRKYPVS